LVAWLSGAVAGAGRALRGLRPPRPPRRRHPVCFCPSLRAPDEETDRADPTYRGAGSNIGTGWTAGLPCRSRKRARRSPDGTGRGLPGMTAVAAVAICRLTPFRHECQPVVTTVTTASKDDPEGGPGPQGGVVCARRRRLRPVVRNAACVVWTCSSDEETVVIANRLFGVARMPESIEAPIAPSTNSAATSRAAKL
jgi:hypothetical protein